ncbi:hypothetical protein SVIOM342S_00455 [Streptomyces violaceorubidus]
MRRPGALAQFRRTDTAGRPGAVRRAEDLQAVEGTPERTVAVKTILRRSAGTRIDTSADLKATERFAREVRIMRRLDDPNLTRIVAGGVADDQDGLPYLAMEFVSSGGGSVTWPTRRSGSCPSPGPPPSAPRSLRALPPRTPPRSSTGTLPTRPTSC